MLALGENRMASRLYQVRITIAAQKQLDSFPARDQTRIREAIDGLATEPRPPGCKKLKGSANTWRIRVGNYRVLYEVHDNQLLVLVVEIGHRKDITGRESEATMQDVQTLTGEELVEHLDQVAARVADDAGGNERLIVTHGGRRFAVVPIEDLEYLERIDGQLDDAAMEELRATADDPDRRTSVPFGSGVPKAQSRR
jgi:mRNA interferase RelE/StbE